MKRVFPFKTILTTLISTGIAGSLMGLPVRANEANSANETLIEPTLSQSYNNWDDRADSDTNNLNKIVGITGLAVGTGVIGWQLARQRQHAAVNFMPTTNSNTSLLDRVSPKLRQQLLRMVHNRQTANRLLSGTLTSHPNRPPNWLAEKVIYDLQRDR